MSVQRDRDTVTLCASPHRVCAAPYYVGAHTHSRGVCSVTVQHGPAQSKDMGGLTYPGGAR